MIFASEKQKENKSKKQTIRCHFLSKGAFFWDYSGIGILGIDGICVLLGAIPFSE